MEIIKLAQELGFTLAKIRSIATLQTLCDRLANLPLGEACPMRRDCEDPSATPVQTAR